MIPPFDINGNLPSGVHQVTWQELTDRFGKTEYRQKLIAGLKLAIDALKVAHCQTVYVDGSFVTTKEMPGDFDACWDPTGVNIPLLHSLEPTLFSFGNGRAAQKARFLGELFPAKAQADNVGSTFFVFFQQDRDGKPKGLIALDLRNMP